MPDSFWCQKSVAFPVPCIQRRRMSFKERRILSKHHERFRHGKKNSIPLLISLLLSTHIIYQNWIFYHSYPWENTQILVVCFCNHLYSDLVSCMGNQISIIQNCPTGQGNYYRLQAALLWSFMVFHCIAWALLSGQRSGLRSQTVCNWWWCCWHGITQKPNIHVSILFSFRNKWSWQIGNKSFTTTNQGSWIQTGSNIQAEDVWAIHFSCPYTVK